MADPLVIYSKPQQHTAVVQLNRPEAKNSMSRALVFALRDAWMEAKNDDDVWSIILTGSADTFCAGGDLKENLARAKGEVPPIPQVSISGGGWYPDLQSLNLNKPIIAAVNGYAVGGGFGLALACDIRYCVPAAKFGASEVRWSHMAAWPTYMRTLPLGWGFWLAFTGQMIDSETAFRLGLVQKVSQPENLMDDCLELCETINRNGKLIAQHTKEYAYRHLYEIEGWQSSFAMHGLYYYHLRQSKDYDEGTAAFIQKRRPDYSGEFYKVGDKPPGVG